MTSGPAAKEPSIVRIGLAVLAVCAVSAGLRWAVGRTTLTRFAGDADLPGGICIDPGGDARAVQTGPDTVLELHGNADFDLDEPGAPEHLRVLAGADVVEAKGARFRVAATANGMAAVDVASGDVVLSLAGAKSRLSAGARWRRAGVSGARLEPCRRER